MKICVLVDRRGHPVLEALARELARRGDATVAAVQVGATPPPDDADVYLLKSRTEAALSAARRAELRGASVLNTVAATSACLDRVHMGQRLRAAGLPFPATLSAPALDCLQRPRWPLIVKSRRSRRGDLVRLVSSHAELARLASAWAGEEVIVQRVVRQDGWEHKVWVIGDRCYAARRRPRCGEQDDDGDVRIPCEQLPEALQELARAVGRAFGLELYGVDVLAGAQGPVIVDVNAFPGFRCVPAAHAALAAHVLRVAGREPVAGGTRAAVGETRPAMGCAP
jgi:ribosomal protein S6--L-glutamate ligase